MSETKQLPPDPEEMNQKRGEWETHYDAETNGEGKQFE